MIMKALEVNGRTYQWMKEPLVVVCVDGCEYDYLTEVVKTGKTPFLEKILKDGNAYKGDCVVPSFTNPNNLSIVTGRPPSVHGICGNFFFDPDLKEEVMMNEVKYLRAETVLAKFSHEGAKVAVITAKDKLRKLLGHQIVGGICFSSEKADQCTVDENGITGVLEMIGMPLPSVYSADLSEFVFAAGVKIMESVRPDLMYLSTTDYIQHKYAPGTDGANDFYIMMDSYLSKLDKLGVTIAITADHGMNAKTNSEGKPNVIYLQDLADQVVGKDNARVILPITDPYVVHHGALGSYATIYISNDLKNELVEKLKATPGISKVLNNSEACSLFELPNDRVGDLVIVSDKSVVLGTSESRHDLSGLDAPLRSHGGISEQTVPLLFNRRLIQKPNSHLRNFDILDISLNSLEPRA
ncbi:phosphonoacetate hydrolase [Polynucleobacter sp. MWH-UH23A]|uniref:phosphonoacetate hydrolase n=1 Tax=Polynucleobacter sp. MWH-UH23A TaxID=1855613 RepID=UPI003364DA8E